MRGGYRTYATPLALCAALALLALRAGNHALVVAGGVGVVVCGAVVAARRRWLRAAAPASPHNPDPVVRTVHAHVRESLLLHMRTSHPYRNPDLRVSDLADSLGVPVHVLSAVINREFGSNFFDFVNRHRVDEAAHLLLDPARRGFTILSIANDVGFASKTAFNRAFKKCLGVTPSEYQRQELSRRQRNCSG